MMERLVVCCRVMGGFTGDDRCKYLQVFKLYLCLPNVVGKIYCSARLIEFLGDCYNSFVLVLLVEWFAVVLM